MGTSWLTLGIRGRWKKKFNMYTHILPVHYMERELARIFVYQLPVLPLCICILILSACTGLLVSVWQFVSVRSSLVVVVVYLVLAQCINSSHSHSMLHHLTHRAGSSSVTIVTEAGRKTSMQRQGWTPVVTLCSLTHPKIETSNQDFLKSNKYFNE